MVVAENLTLPAGFAWAVEFLSLELQGKRSSEAETLQFESSMKPRSAPKISQLDLFQARFEQLLNLNPPLCILANTREVLYLLNRPGNRPSHERAFVYFDRSFDRCRRAGFRSIRMRGDTDFSQSRHLDRWHNDGVQFVFGFVRYRSLKKLRKTCRSLHGNS